MARYYGPKSYPSITTVLGVLARYQGIDPDVLTRKANTIGKPVHKYTAAIDQGITWFPGGIPQRIDPYIEQHKRCVDERVERIIWVEKRLVSDIFKFGGTLDRLWVLKGKRFPSVTDLKTTVGIDNIVRMQLAAQRQLAEENYKRKIDHDTYALQLFKDRYILHPIEDYGRGIQGFHYALWLYHYLGGG